MLHSLLKSPKKCQTERHPKKTISLQEGKGKKVAEIKDFEVKKIKRVKAEEVNEKTGENNFFISFERVSDISF